MLQANFLVTPNSRLSRYDSSSWKSLWTISILPIWCRTQFQWSPFWKPSKILPPSHPQESLISNTAFLWWILVHFAQNAHLIVYFSHQSNGCESLNEWWPVCKKKKWMMPLHGLVWKKAYAVCNIPHDPNGYTTCRNPAGTPREPSILAAATWPYSPVRWIMNHSFIYSLLNHLRATYILINNNNNK